MRVISWAVPKLDFCAESAGTFDAVLLCNARSAWQKRARCGLIEGGEIGGCLGVSIGAV